MAFMSSAQPAFGAVNSGFSFGSAVSETKSAPKTEITNKPQIPPLGKITVIQTSSQIIIRSCAVYFRTIFFCSQTDFIPLLEKQWRNMDWSEE